jgi:hypothetical protein
MKQLIKKILKEETLKQNLKQQMKDFGWKDTAELVGGSVNLVKLGFNNNPIEFLNMFNDLDVVQSKEEKYWTLFRYEKRNNMMVYDRKNDEVSINYDVIWSFLENGFGLNYYETQELTKDWLGDTYNLRGITTFSLSLNYGFLLSETYNLKYEKYN